VVTAADSDGARRLCIDGEPVTPSDLQVRSVLSAAEGTVVFQANPLGDPTVLHVHRWSETGVEQLTTGPGVHAAARGGSTIVIRSASLDHDGVRTRVAGGPTLVTHAEVPLVRPRPQLFRGGPRDLAIAVLLPAGMDPDDSSAKLPVLLDPYGGPHAQRVQQSRAQFLTSQWFADQGFAVVVADGRGTPGRGTDWERAVHRDLAGPVLEDQVDALEAAAERVPCLDRSRVGIRGWSFGGYLAALAVLRRPDVFHAAVAGAPVTEWRLYDTHYTERYLGDPSSTPSPTTGRRSCPTPPAPATPPARARPGRRQRGGGPHPPAVGRAARRRPAPLGAAAVGRDPHDPPGAGGREPPAPAARLPPARPRHHAGLIELVGFGPPTRPASV
jgi:dipeptidyl-peptidase 4